MSRLPLDTKYVSRTTLAVLGLLLVALPLPARAQMNYNEAPQLAEQVAAGELSPVEERLPENPLVVEPLERIGQYGGAWQMYIIEEPGAIFDFTFGREPLMMWDAEYGEALPNIAESVEVSDDATEFVFHLRRGMRWSDGHPFTADDIMFWYEDAFLNEELVAVRPNWLVVDGEPVVVEKIDDHTIKFTFARPNGFFLMDLSGSQAANMVQLPRHYLEQFHINHNPDGIDGLMREGGFSHWTELFTAQAGLVFPIGNRYVNAERPVLSAWQLTSGYSGQTRATAQRNPYYWKVDSEGNQLPYLDRIEYQAFLDADAALLEAMRGQFDVVTEYLNTLSNKVLFFDNAEQGNYRFIEVGEPLANIVLISINLTHDDPVKREIFQNKDFRIGLSHAINRQEIIDLILIGQGEPWQVAPVPSSPLYNEQLGTQYLEYDVELANDYLDRAGYAERDAQGYRLGPDGQRITFTVEVAQPLQTDVMELVVAAWQEVGLNALLRTQEPSLLLQRRNTNEFDVLVWGEAWGDRLVPILTNPNPYVPVNPRFAPRWGEWYTGGGLAEEPPAEVQRQLALYDQVKGTTDLDRQVELMHEILEISAEQFYTLGIARGSEPGYGVVKNDFHNVPDWVYGGWAYGGLMPANPATFFRGE